MKDYLDRDKGSNSGLVSGALSYILWGILPLYWKLFKNVSPDEILCHRILWSALILVVWMIATKTYRSLPLIGSKEITHYAFAAIVLSINWGTYIWAVSNSYVLASSLGYFVAPLLYVLVGVLVLKEPFSKMQALSLSFCFSGLLVLLAYSDIVTFIVALVLACSIVGYGYLRKKGNQKPLVGLLIESTVLLPLSLMWLYYRGYGSIFYAPSETRILLASSGFVTLLPLIFYCSAIKKLTLSLMGYLQYLSPIIQFLIGVLIFNENLSMERLFAFSCVWIGIFILIVSSLIDRIYRS